MIRRVHERLDQHRPTGDAGTTLIELLVGMVIMSIFLGMFTSAMYLMSSTTAKVQIVSDTTNQLTDTFMTLDREVRFASTINDPAYVSASSTWHVEFATSVINRTNPQNPSDMTYYSSTTQCTQLAVAPSTTNGPDVLEQRTWTVNDAAGPSAWRVLATGLLPYDPNAASPPVAGSPRTATTAPFSDQAGTDTGNASSQYQQLTLNLQLAPNGRQPDDPSVAPTDNLKTGYTFTALNSITAANSTPVCQQYPVGG